VLLRSLWRALLRVGNRVVVEQVVLEQHDDGEPVVVVSCGCASDVRVGGSAAGVGGCRRAMTLGAADGGGGVWTRA
jgi:hypothetical protein